MITNTRHYRRQSVASATGSMNAPVRGVCVCGCAVWWVCGVRVWGGTGGNPDPALPKGGHTFLPRGVARVETVGEEAKERDREERAEGGIGGRQRRAMMNDVT